MAKQDAVALDCTVVAHSPRYPLTGKPWNVDPHSEATPVLNIVHTTEGKLSVLALMIMN